MPVYAILVIPDDAPLANVLRDLDNWCDDSEHALSWVAVPDDLARRAASIVEAI